MPIYNPTDANFLTVAQSRTNNGQNDVRVILDITTNIFYTLDDNGNFIEIQSSGGGEDLEQTLGFGNSTNGNNIIMTSGDVIEGETDATLYTTDGDIVATVSSNNDGFFVYNQLFVDMPSTGDNTLLQQYPDYLTLTIENKEKLTIEKTRHVIVNEQFELRFPQDNGEYVVKKRNGGDLLGFLTTGDTPTELFTFTPTANIVRVKARISGYGDIAEKGYYNEITAAYRQTTVPDFVALGAANEITISEFLTADSYLDINATNISDIVVGEAATDIYWTVEIDYSDE